MKLFGSLTELVATVFRKNNQNITLRPNQATTYTAARDIQTPPQDANSVLVSESATQTLSNKTMGSTNTLTGSTSASFTNTGTISLPTTTDTLIGRVSTDQGANRLKNKDLEDATVAFVDDGDATKKFRFQASGITTGTTRTITVPDADITLASRAGTETLQNKTLDNTNTITVKDANFTIQDDGDTTKQAVFQASSITTATTRTYILPDGSTTLVGTALLQTLSNKAIDNSCSITMKGNSFTLEDQTDVTKQATFDMSGITTGTSRTFTFPDANTTLVGTATTQTLSNKTLASPTITTSSSYSNQAAIKFFEQTGNGTNFIAFEAPDAVTSDTTFKLPDGDGSVGQVLKTDGSKNLGWTSVATNSLNQFNVNVGDSGNTAQQANTSLLGDISATYLTSTVTITNASPTVVTWTSHGLSSGDRVYFTSTGSLPSGLSTSTTYWITVINANTFNVSSTLSNAQTGTYINTTTAGSGTHSGFAGALKIRATAIPGIYDGSTPTAGYVGEYFIDTAANDYSASQSATQQTTRSVPPGIWKIEVRLHIEANGTGTGNNFSMLLNAPTSGSTDGTDKISNQGTSTANTGQFMGTCANIYSFSAATTVTTNFTFTRTAGTVGPRTAVIYQRIR